ncbi:MAG: PhnD/SsuA/transferrin family substrate-binding protein [Rhodospirillaceae bacterium]|nr:PhnD/SsuA/transferrin family substrate-binding protein [Rhodospirillaceae bacterium]
MIVALPMYDLPEIAAATDAFWQGLRGHLSAAGLTGLPVALSRPEELYIHWLDPQLALSQTCGYPLTHMLRGRIRYLATPYYDADGCRGPRYRSFVIVRADDAIEQGRDLAGRKAAFNGTDSQSGYNILKHYLNRQGVRPGSLAGAVESGGHRRSVALVKSGGADFCAVDCVTWALLQAHAPEETEGLRVLDKTSSAPSLPFVTSRDTPIENIASLRSGLGAAMTDPGLADCRATLLLESITVLDEDAYEVILEQERESSAAGWSVLA